MIPSMDNPYTYLDAETYAFDPGAPIIRGARRGIVVDADPGDQPELSLDTPDQQEYDQPMPDDQPILTFTLSGFYADDPDVATTTLFERIVKPGPEYEDRVVRACIDFTERCWEFWHIGYEGWLDSRAGKAGVLADVLRAVAFLPYDERSRLYSAEQVDEAVYKTVARIYRDID